MNKKRKEIEDTVIKIAKESPQAASAYMLSVSGEYMNAFGRDISAAIDKYNKVSVPWIVAMLEIYAGALRQQMNERGNELADELKEFGEINVVRMCVPRGG